jgi:hypothetical protein
VAGWVARSQLRVRASSLARPYLGAAGGGAGGRIGVVAAAHSSGGSGTHARGYSERAASLSVRWGLCWHV